MKAARNGAGVEFRALHTVISYRCALIIAILLLLAIGSHAESGGKQKEALIYLGPSAFSRDGKYVAVGLRYGTKGESVKPDAIEKVFLWDVESGKFLRTYSHVKRGAILVDFSFDSKRLFALDLGGVFHIWELEKGRKVSSFPTQDVVSCHAIDHKDNVLLTVGSDEKEEWSKIKFWDINKGKLIKSYRLLVRPSRIFLSPDGKTLIETTANYGPDTLTLQVWDLVKEKVIVKVKSTEPHSFPPMIISPDNKIVISQRYEKKDCYLTLWELATGKEIRKIAFPEGHLQKLAFTPDGKKALSGTASGILQRWDLETGKPEWTVKTRTTRKFDEYVFSFAFSQNGKRAFVANRHSYAASNAIELQIWDSDKPKFLRNLTFPEPDFNP